MIVLWLTALILGVSGGDAPAEVLPTGQLVEGLSCRSDPTQTYTLYLPSAYTTEHRWPAMLVLDPRGRSVLAAELFRDAAETYGWILVSSDNTRSDGPMEPNHRALNALWPEVNTRFATDHDRVYAAGFSGGAHLGWLLGKKTGRLAGVIACGGRLIPEYLEGTSFAVFGAAGETDFNYQGMRRVHELLEEQGNPQRLEVFAGTHQWMPANLATEAVAWMEVQAMRRDLRPQDDDLLDRLLAGDLAAARSLEADGEVLAAEKRYEAIVRTFAGLRHVAEAERRAGALAATPEYARAAEDEQRWDSFEDSYRVRMFNACADLRASDVPVSVGKLARDLQIAALARQADADGSEGTTARRLLDTVFTQTSFYLHGPLRAGEEYGKAAVALAVATRIRPSSATTWYNLACAHALDGSSRKALEALERAVELGFDDLDLMRSDPDLVSLRAEERYAALVAGAEQDRAPADRLSD